MMPKTLSPLVSLLSTPQLECHQSPDGYNSSPWEALTGSAAEMRWRRRHGGVGRVVVEVTMLGLTIRTNFEPGLTVSMIISNKCVTRFKILSDEHIPLDGVTRTPRGKVKKRSIRGDRHR